MSKNKQKKKHSGTNPELISATPYDDVFRTLQNDLRSMILPLLNEAFGEHYTGEEEIIFSSETHMVNKPGGGNERRTVDAGFIVKGDSIKHYHLESQSTADTSLLLRIFEYDTQIALDQTGRIKDHTLKVSLPRTAVIFLRSNKDTPDAMKIEIETPGGTVVYKIPVIRLISFTLDDLFRKDLLILLPFYIFNFEKEFGKMEISKSYRVTLTEIFCHIREKLQKLSENNQISEYEKRTIIEMTQKVIYNLTQKYQRVREELCEIMGGQILDYEAKDILRAGERRGEKRGEKRGRIIGEKAGRIIGEKTGKIMEFISIRSEDGWSRDMIIDTLISRYGIKIEEANDYYQKYRQLSRGEMSTD